MATPFASAGVQPQSLRRRGTDAAPQPPPAPPHRPAQRQPGGVYPVIPPSFGAATEQVRNQRRKQAISAAVNAATATNAAGPCPAPKAARSTTATSSSSASCLAAPCGSGPCPAVVFASLGALYLFPCSVLLMAGAFLAATGPGIARQHARERGEGETGPPKGGDKATGACAGRWNAGNRGAHAHAERCCAKFKDFGRLAAPVFILAWFVGLKMCCAVFIVGLTAAALRLHDEHRPGERPAACKLVGAGVLGFLLLGARPVIVGAFAFKMLQNMYSWPQRAAGQCVGQRFARRAACAGAATTKPGEPPGAAGAAGTSAGGGPAPPHRPAQLPAQGQQGRWTTQTWPDGSHYAGAMLGGKRHGEGSYSWADGSHYTGGWKDDKLHGTGVFRFANGDRFEGQYTQDRKHGQGKYTWAEAGNVFEGRWEDDKMVPNSK